MTTLVREQLTCKELNASRAMTYHTYYFICRRVILELDNKSNIKELDKRVKRKQQIITLRYTTSIIIIRIITWNLKCYIFFNEEEQRKDKTCFKFRTCLSLEIKSLYYY